MKKIVVTSCDMRIGYVVDRSLAKSRHPCPGGFVLAGYVNLDKVR